MAQVNSVRVHPIFQIIDVTFEFGRAQQINSRQYLYFCTRKARSYVLLRQYLYFFLLVNQVTFEVGGADEDKHTA